VCEESGNAATPVHTVTSSLTDQSAVCLSPVHLTLPKHTYTISHSVTYCDSSRHLLVIYITPQDYEISTAQTSCSMTSKNICKKHKISNVVR